MCISVALINKSLYFGRNMDLESDFGQQIAIVPRSYPFVLRHEKVLDNHFAMIGMAAVIDGFPLYADAVNEFGLCVSGLNFPDNACYATALSASKHNITPYELIPWILGRCADIAEARELLKNTCVYAEPFSDNVPLTPLHWHFADKTGSLVLEIVRDGMHIYDNPANVLTNNPPLDFHITNLSHYLNLTPENPKNCLTSITGDKPFGKGLGNFGLPGDYSPTSRFVKAAYLLHNTPFTEDKNESAAQLCHILDAVSVVNGCIRLGADSQYRTVYSSCIDAEECIYYYKTYNNIRLSGVKLFNENLDGEQLCIFNPEQEQLISWAN